jgi:hypothetical protein
MAGVRDRVKDNRPAGIALDTVRRGVYEHLAAGEESAVSEAKVLEVGFTPPGEGELLERMGYAAPEEAPPLLREAARKACELLAELARPRAVFRILPLRCVGGRLKIGDRTFRPPPAVASLLAACPRAAVLVATAGEGAGREADREGAGSLGLCLEQAAGLLAEKALGGAMEQAAGALEPGERLTQRTGPGLCGWGLEEQKILLGLADSGRIGVRTTDAAYLLPRHSVSAVAGLGAGHAGSPCPACDRADCEERRG